MTLFNETITSTDICGRNRSEQNWAELSRKYLPYTEKNSIWRLNRPVSDGDAVQGWKLHVSGTILDAAAIFAKIAPFLKDCGVQFKAPSGLSELSKLNSGLHYGYSQVGKFVTVYPRNSDEAVSIAYELDQLTRGYFSVRIPHDRQFSRGSSVFYRYGAFQPDSTEEDFLEMPDGSRVPDDRTVPVPHWVVSPFGIVTTESPESGETPLSTRYRVFKALSQRGKGGAFLAIDSESESFDLCVIKQGLDRGEVHWNGQDGALLVRNEARVLSQIGKRVEGVPCLFDRFTIGHDQYVVMEFFEGRSLLNLVSRRRRRLATRIVIDLMYQIASLIDQIHNAGWIWNDCKPANLIVGPDRQVRAIDFENAFPIASEPRFDWGSKGYSKPSTKNTRPVDRDLFALGAVGYFLLTGRIFDHSRPEPIRACRKGVSSELCCLIDRLLYDDRPDFLNAEAIMATLVTLGKRSQSRAHVRRDSNRESVRRSSKSGSTGTNGNAGKLSLHAE